MYLGNAISADYGTDLDVIVGINLNPPVFAPIWELPLECSKLSLTPISVVSSVICIWLHPITDEELRQRTGLVQIDMLVRKLKWVGAVLQTISCVGFPRNTYHRIVEREFKLPWRRVRGR